MISIQVNVEKDKVITTATKTQPECFWEGILCGWIVLQSNSSSSLHKMGQTQISAVQVPQAAQLKKCKNKNAITKD